jgi:hypothetical protein
MKMSLLGRSSYRVVLYADLVGVDHILHTPVFCGLGPLWLIPGGSVLLVTCCTGSFRKRVLLKNLAFF